MTKKKPAQAGFLIAAEPEAYFFVLSDLDWSGDGVIVLVAGGGVVAGAIVLAGGVAGFIESIAAVPAALAASVAAAPAFAAAVPASLAAAAALSLASLAAAAALSDAALASAAALPLSPQAFSASANAAAKNTDTNLFIGVPLHVYEKMEIQRSNIRWRKSASADGRFKRFGKATEVQPTPKC
ncbi:MAG TPA: hypothetical protein VH704_01570 [Casimicrobiaceae bacterium]|nr:hypothetical protein [Casimicrobiaceae bacterium]